MKALLLLMALAGCLTPPVTGPSAPRRLLIVSIDGLRPEVYLGSDFDTPTLHRLAKEGARAEDAEPIYPTVTYPNHTTIATGVRSVKHGVWANTVFSMEKGAQPSVWYWQAADIKVQTLWGAVHASSKTAALVNWPATVGADADWVIPEIFDPADFSQTPEMVRKVSTPAFFDAVAPKTPAFASFDEHDEWVADAAIYAMKTLHADLTMVHLANLDHAQHSWGRSSDQTLVAASEIDRLAGKLVQAAQTAGVTLFILGDHGFVDYHNVYNVNALFAKEGWITEAGWSVMAQANGGNAPVYLRDPSLGDRAAAVLRTNAKGHYRIIEKPELAQLGAFPEAFCALEPVDDWIIGQAASPLEERTGRTRGHHGWRPERLEMRTGFIAFGPGVKRSKNLGTVRLLDVAATAAQFLGVSLPQTEGRLISFAN